jgi:hypothetical protein
LIIVVAIETKVFRAIQIIIMKEFRNIFIEPTEKTPQVDFNYLTGELILAGKSIPENATEIYEPLFNWVCEYSKNARQTTNLRLNLEYFNTASSIWLAKIVKSLSRIENPDSILFIHLYFNIEEFDNMDVEDIKDALSHVVDIINNSTMSIGIKIYGTDDKGVILKESMVLI